MYQEDYIDLLKKIMDSGPYFVPLKCFPLFNTFP